MGIEKLPSGSKIDELRARRLETMTVWVQDTTRSRVQDVFGLNRILRHSTNVDEIDQFFWRHQADMTDVEKAAFSASVALLREEQRLAKES